MEKHIETANESLEAQDIRKDSVEVPFYPSSSTVTFPPIPDIPVSFRVNSEGKVEAVFDGFASL